MGKKTFGLKKCFGKKKIRSKKFLGQKNFGVKKYCLKKFFLIYFNPKFVLCKEKTGRVNPRWRIYDPPPQKIVGLKLCWIVVSFAW